MRRQSVKKTPPKIGGVFLLNTLTGSLSSAALLIDALPALDTAQRGVGNAQQAIHLLGGVFVGVPLMVHE